MAKLDKSDTNNINQKAQRKFSSLAQYSESRI